MIMEKVQINASVVSELASARGLETTVCNGKMFPILIVSVHCVKTKINGF